MMVHQQFIEARLTIIELFNATDNIGERNTPANNRWFLNILTRSTNDTLFESPIAFLPNGAIDFRTTSIQQYEDTTAIFQPTIEADFESSFSFWKAINWIFVSLYWTVLADLGQVAPTIYYPWDQLGNSTAMPPTNNIFVNKTLFQEYSMYLTNNVLPLLNLSIAEFLPVDDKNHLKVQNATFVRSYACLNRRTKAPLNLLISVGVADYALILGVYKLTMFLVEIYHKRKYEAGNGTH